MLHNLPFHFDFFFWVDNNFSILPVELGLLDHFDSFFLYKLHDFDSFYLIYDIESISWHINKIIT